MVQSFIRTIKCVVVIITLSFFVNGESLPIGGIWKQVGSDIDGKVSLDLFGWSVAMSSDGTTIVIGAPTAFLSGYVRVYSMNTTTIGNWQQIGSDIIGKTVSDYFGHSVCISDDGKTIAAGAIGNDDNGSASGHVRVYSYNSITNMWTQVGTDINGEASFDQSGWSVDMSADGKTIAIGALGNDNTNGGNSGHVRVYNRNTTSGTWTQVGADIDGKAASDRSGYSVAMSSDEKTIAIGTPYNSANTGHVRVFSNNATSTNWTQIGSDINGKAGGAYSGNSVAISSDGKTIAIGAPGNIAINSNVSGYVRVYTINGTSSNWTQVGSDINGVALNDQSGYSVAMSSNGKTIAIGAIRNDNSNGDDSGHVRVFSINSTSGDWTQVGSDIIGEGSGDQSGYSIAMSYDGLTVAIGAPYNDNPNKTDAGHVRIFKYELPTKSPTRAPTKVPSKSPTKKPTKRPTNNPTRAPLQIILPVPIQVPLSTPVVAPTNCGLFGLNFFCPRRWKCGFWRRLLNLHGC